MNSNKVSDHNFVQVSPHKTRRTIHTENLMVAVWDFSGGPWDKPEPYHSHPQEQIIYLAAGEVLFFCGEESCNLKCGDTVAIPGDQPHTVQLLTPEARLVDSWTPIRPEFL
jgi:quercetin dioxygenase-like cupin family protein